MIGDNFMWDPREFKDKAFVGETNDTYFGPIGAFEVSAFGFGMSPGGGDVSTGKDGEGEEGGGAGGAGGKGGVSPLNKGLPGGVKLGGSILRKAGSSSTGGGGGLIGGTGSTGGGKTGAKGKPKFGSLTVNKFVDNASTSLYEFCSTGVPIPTINLCIRKSGGDGLLYLQYCFREVQITGISWEGGSGESRPKETFTLEFKAMGMQYIQQSAIGRAVSSAPKEWRWSVETEEGNQTLDIGGVPPDEPVFLPGNVE